MTATLSDPADAARAGVQRETFQAEAGFDLGTLRAAPQALVANAGCLRLIREEGGPRSLLHARSGETARTPNKRVAQ